MGMHLCGYALTTYSAVSLEALLKCRFLVTSLNLNMCVCGSLNVTYPA